MWESQTEWRSVSVAKQVYLSPSVVRMRSLAAALELEDSRSPAWNQAVVRCPKYSGQSRNPPKQMPLIEQETVSVEISKSHFNAAQLPSCITIQPSNYFNIGILIP
jgi:hypothetical protein